ncbi:MAG TPA: alpha/beta hydrolase [Saprospiraceae bacterium]|nr:alpha/beta hydrolase [Saprospiraceae bacterium]
MPLININSVNYHYEDNGQGATTLVFSHGLLWSGHMYHKQVEYFSKTYRVITYDHRGQGQTEGTNAGYDMDTLTEDAVELIKKLCPNTKVIFIGLSMGGFVGMRLAARYPEVIEKLILLNTSCDEEPKSNQPKYRLLNFMVKIFGIWSVIHKVMPIMFGKFFLEDKSRADEKKYWASQLKKCRKKYITKAVEGVINRQGICDELYKINCPTLVIGGDQDVATVLEKSKKIHSLINGSQYVVISSAGHSSVIEEPAQVNEVIANFLYK